MTVKLIKVRVKSGRLAEYLAAQRVWNRETAGATGYLGQFCGQDPNEADVVYLLFMWRSRADLDRWVADEHDRIAALARADEHYEHLEVRVLDEVLPADLPWMTGPE